jgi:putative tricarboxylic transport membrane protein
MKNRDLISGIVLFIGGVARLLKTLSFTVGTLRMPGAGLLPLIASILLLVLSATLMLQAVLPKKTKAAEAPPFFPEKGASRRILLCFAGMIGFRCLFPVIGFAPTTGLFILFLLKYLGGYGWKTSMLYAVVTAIVGYYLFQVWLKIPMPLPILRL